MVDFNIVTTSSQLSSRITTDRPICCLDSLDSSTGHAGTYRTCRQPPLASKTSWQHSTCSLTIRSAYFPHLSRLESSLPSYKQDVIQPTAGTTMEPTRKPMFTSLPREIKDSIYKHAVDEPCLRMDITPRRKTKAERDAVPSSEWCGTMRIRHMKQLEVGHVKVYAPASLVSLLLTCRQINYEVQPLHAAATEQLVMRCIGTAERAGYGGVGGFSDDGRGVSFDKVSKALFTQSRNLTPVLRRFLTLRKATRKHAAFLAFLGRFENVKTVVIEHWDPYVTLPTLELYVDSMMRIKKAVSITARGDAFWEWISSNKNIQSVVVRWFMMESDKEKRIAVSDTSMEVVYNMKAGPFTSSNVDGHPHNLDTRWQIISDPVGSHGSHEEEEVTASMAHGWVAGPDWSLILSR